MLSHLQNSLRGLCYLLQNLSIIKGEMCVYWGTSMPVRELSDQRNQTPTEWGLRWASEPPLSEAVYDLLVWEQVLSAILTLLNFATSEYLMNTTPCDPWGLREGGQLGDTNFKQDVSDHIHCVAARAIGWPSFLLFMAVSPSLIIMPGT